MILTYWKTLPDELLTNIVRLAAKEKGKCSFDMSWLFSDDGPFIGTPSLLFHSLRVPARESQEVRKIIEPLIRLPAGLCYARDSTIRMDLNVDVALRRSVFRKCGEVFEYVWLSACCYDAPIMNRTAIREFAVEVASCCKSGVRLLIETMDYMDPFIAIAIEEFCAALGEKCAQFEFRDESSYLFNLVHPPISTLVVECQQLKFFEYAGFALNHLLPVWVSLGGTLERVNISLDRTRGQQGEWSSCLNGLRTHCRRLTCIYLMNPLMDCELSGEKYAEFLASYGEQLQSATIFFDSAKMGNEALAHIGRSCPNLRSTCIISMVGFEYCLERIHAICNQIDGLILGLCPNWEHAYVNLQPLRNLRKFALRRSNFLATIPHQLMVKLFAPERPNLSHVYIRNRIDLHSLCVFTNRSYRLKQICFECSTIKSMAPIETLVRMNPQLQLVEIVLYDDAAKSIAATVRGLLNAIMKGEAINFLKLDLHPEDDCIHPGFHVFKQLWSPYRYCSFQFFLNLRYNPSGLRRRYCANSSDGFVELK